VWYLSLAVVVDHNLLTGIQRTGSRFGLLLTLKHQDRRKGSLVNRCDYAPTSGIQVLSSEGLKISQFSGMTDCIHPTLHNHNPTGRKSKANVSGPAHYQLNRRENEHFSNHREDGRFFRNGMLINHPRSIQKKNVIVVQSKNVISSLPAELPWFEVSNYEYF
jgi:hypothetical protein